MVKKDISSVKNWNEVLWETALYSVNSSHRVTAFPWRSLWLRLFLWNFQTDIWKPIEATVKNDISSVKNWKEGFWETSLCSVNSSHRVTAFPSRSLSLRLFLRNLQSDIWKLIEGYGKRKYLPLKTGKMLSEKLLCVLLINLTQLQLSPQEPFRWDCSCGICKVIFGGP